MEDEPVYLSDIAEEETDGPGADFQRQRKTQGDQVDSEDSNEEGEEESLDLDGSEGNSSSSGSGPASSDDDFIDDRELSSLSGSTSHNTSSNSEEEVCTSFVSVEAKKKGKNVRISAVKRKQRVQTKRRLLRRLSTGSSPEEDTVLAPLELSSDSMVMIQQNKESSFSALSESSFEKREQLLAGSGKTEQLDDSVTSSESINYNRHGLRNTESIARKQSNRRSNFKVVLGSDSESDEEQGTEKSVATATAAHASGVVATTDLETGECSLCQEIVPASEQAMHVEICGNRRDFCAKCSGWILLCHMAQHQETECEFGKDAGSGLADGAAAWSKDHSDDGLGGRRDFDDDASNSNAEVHDSNQNRHARLNGALAGFDSDWQRRSNRPGRWYLGKKFWIPDRLYETLVQHQREGVAFLWGLYEREMGGVLGDDMGLGKTIQCVAYVAGLANARGPKYGYAVVVIVEVSMLKPWRDEFKKWADIDVVQVHDQAPKRRRALIDRVREEGGILLTTYGVAKSMIASFKPQTLTGTSPGDKWDAIILDEGHKIKNHNTQLSRALRMIVSRQRLILSGTIIQNKLTELWAIFDYVCNRRLLGTIRTFKSAFETPIEQGAKKGASDETRREAARMQNLLWARITPHHLRRDRKMIEEPVLLPSNRKLDDYVVWLKLTDAQIDLTRELLSSDAVKEAMDTRNPLTLIQGLRTITEHPMLLRSKQHLLQQLPRASLERWGVLMHAHSHPHTQQGEEGNENDVVEGSYFDLSTTKEWQECVVQEDDPRHIENCLPDELLLMIFSYICRRTDSVAAASVCRRWHYVLRVEIIDPASAKFLMATSSKMSFLSQVLPIMYAEGHRVLIFAEQRRMLDMVGAFLRAAGLEYLHMDGNTSSRERGRAVDRFNQAAENNDSLFAFLTTTGCGAVGLTLTGADRVIILDPSWNPSSDLQAVHRAFRIGQKKDVVCYRLITNGTIEESVYKRQVFKGSIREFTMRKWSQQGFFTDHDLHGEIFNLGDTEASATRSILNERATALISTSTEGAEVRKKLAAMADLESTLRTLPGQSCFSGLSDHSLVFADDNSAVSQRDRGDHVERTPRRTASQSAIDEANEASEPEDDGPEEAVTAPLPRVAAASSKHTPRARNPTVETMQTPVFNGLDRVPKNTPVSNSFSATAFDATPVHPYRARQREGATHNTPLGGVGIASTPTMLNVSNRKTQKGLLDAKQRLTGSAIVARRLLNAPATGTVSRKMRQQIMEDSESDASDGDDGDGAIQDMDSCEAADAGAYDGPAPRSPACRQVFLKGVKIEGIAGRGNFSVVYAGRHNGRKVALKLPHTDQDAEFQHEVHMLSQLKHPNVLEYFGLYRNRYGTYIVTEWMQCSLKDYLHESKSGDLSIIDLLQIIRRAASGMQFLSERNPPVLHRDIAARNLLISESGLGGKSFIVKVADLGMARSLYTSNYYVANNKTVAANWAAPEVLTKAHFSVASDVYSMGVTAWECLTLGTVPYHDINGALDVRSAIAAIKSGQVLPPPGPDFQCPDSVYRAVLLPCWAMDKAKRPNFRELVQAIEHQIELLSAATDDSDIEDVAPAWGEDKLEDGCESPLFETGLSASDDGFAHNEVYIAETASAAAVNAGYVRDSTFTPRPAQRNNIRVGRASDLASEGAAEHQARRRSIENILSPRKTIFVSPRAPPRAVLPSSAAAQSHLIDQRSSPNEKMHGCVDRVPTVLASDKSFTDYADGKSTGTDRKPLRPINTLPEDDRRAYNGLIAAGETCEQDGQNERALMFALRALETCDEDRTLHLKAIALADELGLWSENSLSVSF